MAAVTVLGSWDGSFNLHKEAEACSKVNKSGKEKQDHPSAHPQASFLQQKGHKGMEDLRKETEACSKVNKRGKENIIILLHNLRHHLCSIKGNCSSYEN
eukprot:1160871-Pelagomonas_calceolata.AAC.9